MAKKYLSPKQAVAHLRKLAEKWPPEVSLCMPIKKEKTVRAIWEEEGGLHWSDIEFPKGMKELLKNE